MGCIQGIARNVMGCINGIDEGIEGYIIRISRVYREPAEICGGSYGPVAWLRVWCKVIV